MLVREVDEFVDLVADRDDAVVLAKHVGQRRGLGFRVHRTGRVARRRVHHHAGFGRDGRLEFARLDFVVVVDARGQHHGHAASHLDDFLVADPVRGGEDDLVSGVDQREDHVGEALLGARADHHLVHGVFQSVVALELLHDGLADARRARNRGVVRFVGFDGVDARLLHFCRRVKVGLSERKGDDVDALILELACLSRHGDGGGFAEALQEVRSGVFHGE